MLLKGCCRVCGCALNVCFAEASDIPLTWSKRGTKWYKIQQCSICISASSPCISPMLNVWLMPSGAVYQSCQRGTKQSGKTTTKKNPERWRASYNPRCNPWKKTRERRHLGLSTSFNLWEAGFRIGSPVLSLRKGFVPKLQYCARNTAIPCHS